MFGIFVERILKHEGGFIDHPADPGGATNYGITQRVARKHGYSGDMRDFPRAHAIEVYRRDYWETPRIAQLPPALAFQVFDAAVNHGVDRAVRWLQEALEVTADGHIGQKTLAAADAADTKAVALAFNALRTEFYAGLGTFTSFGRGWVRRIAQNLRYLIRDL